MNDWKSIVRNIAPTLGAALGGPAGGMAVKFLADNLLGNAEASQADVEQFIATASPEQMAVLKKLDQDFAIAMRQLDIDVFKIENEDRQNARDLFKVNIWPQIILSSLFILGYFGIMAVLIYFHNANINDRIFGILNTVIGVLTAAIPMILQFWFGSSQGSKDKTARLRTDKSD
ncbi:MAG: hypothetical protein ACRBB6_03000 [Neptuniibacter sp.]